MPPTPLQVELAAIAAATKAATFAMALALRVSLRSAWRSTDLTRQRSVDQFRADAIDLTRAYRAQAVRLALSAYSLRRALATGSPVRLPDGLSHQSLGQVRDDFQRALGGVVDDYSAEVFSDAPANRQVPADVIDLEDRLAELEREEDAAFETLLDSMLEKATREEALLRAQEEDVAAEQAAERRLGHIAAVADKSVQSGVRDVTAAASQRDPRAIGYVRVPSPGCCAWCAAMSGFGVLNKVETFHTNCNCGTEPVFSKSEYESDPRFADARSYEELWSKARKGDKYARWDLDAFKSAYADSQSTGN